MALVKCRVINFSSCVLPVKRIPGKVQHPNLQWKSSLTLANPFFFSRFFLSRCIYRPIFEGFHFCPVSFWKSLCWISTLKKSDILHFQEKLMEHRRTCKSPFKSFWISFDWFVNVFRVMNSLKTEFPDSDVKEQGALLERHGLVAFRPAVQLWSELTHSDNVGHN